MAWNLSVLTIILFCLNQLTANSDSCSIVFKSPFNVLQVGVMVSSLAKLCKSNFLIHRDKSLRNILKRIGPNIENCDFQAYSFGGAIFTCIKSFSY